MQLPTLLLSFVTKTKHEREALETHSLSLNFFFERKKMSDNGVKVVDELSDVLRALSAKLGTVPEEEKVKKYKEVGVQRHDQPVIMLPKGMPEATAIEWIEKIAKAGQTTVQFTHAFAAYPTDGAYSLSLALKDIFGFTELLADRSFFGTNPPQLIDIPIALNETGIIPWGKMRVPNLPGYIQTWYDLARAGLPRFLIDVQTSRESEPTLRTLIHAVELKLKTASIYKGKAVRISFDWIENQVQFNPEAHRPEFMDLSHFNWDSMILNAPIMAALQKFLVRIKHTARCHELGLPIKHGGIFAGDFGTGKTLAAMNIAKLCQENGWTFVYIPKAGHFPQALEFIKPLLPGVIFAEDLDLRASGERDVQMNELLNLIDGSEVKHLPLITIFTTNHPERINRAFLRSGRIDTFVRFAAPDADSALRLLYLYAKDSAGESLLQQDGDFSVSATRMAGMPPAFINTLVGDAKVLALRHNGDGNKFQILPQDLSDALDAIQPHLAIMQEKAEVQTPVETLYMKRLVELINGE